MNIRTFFSALTLTATLFSISSCVKTEETVLPPVSDTAPAIPDGSRINIHFGTSTYLGCMYSFSNCLWIGWGTEVLNVQDRPAIQFDKGDEAGQYFGQYFPLTSDFVIDVATAAAFDIEPQVIPAGFYPIRDASTGQAPGKKTVVFSPDQGLLAGNLVNPKNPQDNIGQLHNLALQVVLNDNRDAILEYDDDQSAIKNLITERTIKFLADAELPVNTFDQHRALSLNLDRDFSNYAARLDETRLSANDKKTLLAIFDEAAAVPVGSPQELSNFVNLMTEHENRLALTTTLDNPKVVLSMISVLKYSRYFWYWKSIATSTPGTGSDEPSTIPDWVWADIIGLEIGGPVVSVIASAVVYLDTH